VKATPAGAPDATGRRAAFLPSAVLGNGSVLATLSARGELERLFWPHVDRDQHLGELRLGLLADGRTRWLDEEPFAWEQRYADDASILHTRIADATLTLELMDLVTPAEPVLVRRIRCDSPGLRLVVRCRPELGEGVRYSAAYVDPGTGALVFYRQDVALAVAVRGGGEASVSTVGRRDDDHTLAHRSPVHGVLEAELDGEACVVISFGSSPAGALAGLARDFGNAEEERCRHDAAQLALAAQVDAEPELSRVYRRSLLTLELLTDRETGATIAAPELDPDFLHSGGYGFVWPRDLAFVVLSFIAAGRGDLVAPALGWLARTQAPEGLWLHRHWTDGALAPSWGLHQGDETGAVLFAYESAWRALGDEELDRSLWPSAKRAGSFLAAFVDPATGLPRASVDLWEQHEGQHSYSAAATAGGLDAAAAMATRHEPALEAGFREAAESVRAGIESELWSEEHGRYLRTRWVGRPDRGGEPVPLAFTSGLPYPNRTALSVDPFDARVDSSLLGLAWPFRAVDPAGTRMRATVEAIERELLQPCGGVLRHEDDDYAGGNPWLLTTLWLGLYYRQVGDEAGLQRCLDYALSRRTALDLLPEQADREGRPAWVLPLAWSHAMLVLAARPELEPVADHGRARQGVEAI
jgi:GH15 family glucan-1,4-alpha-glucosidase